MLFFLFLNRSSKTSWCQVTILCHAKVSYDKSCWLLCDAFCFVYAFIVWQKKTIHTCLEWHDGGTKFWVHYSFKMNSTSVAGSARTHHQIERVICGCFYTVVQIRWLNEWVWYFLNLRPNKALKTRYAKITPHLCSDKCVFVVIFTLQSENASQMTLSLSVWSD